jgi:hypothetical protein
VTSVGGTKLVHKRSGGRAWTETVWGGTAPGAEGTGSGCSAIEAKPSWQSVDDRSPAGCLNRTENDVSADGDPSTGVAVYDTYRTGGTLVTVGGTSVATPIITAVYALAGKPAKGTYPASYPYRHASDFNRVASGANGICESDRQYLCHGERGYNGPGGLGTPKGTGGFSSAGVAPVTVLDPGTQDIGAGQGLRLTVQSVDTDGSARSLSYRASGLPAGLSIGSAARSLNGTISGSVPATAGSYRVTVTAKDTRTGRTGTTRFSIYVIPSLAAPSLATSGQVVGGDDFDGSGCLSAAGETAGTEVQMEFCDDASVSQEWEYLPGAAPGAPATLSITAGICLGLSGSDAVLQSCNGSAGQQWEYLPTGVTSPTGAPTSVLYNPGSGRCLDGQSTGTAGERVIIAGCSEAASAYGQDWAIDAGFSIVAGTGRCIESSSSAAVTAACSAGDSSQSFEVTGGTISGPDGCLAETSLLSGHGTSWESCSGNAAINLGQGVWVPGPGGELINGYSGRCLDDVGSGDHLVQDDCYGLPGEEWALN